MDNVTRKLQLVELSILEDLDEICRKNNLTYYLIGGTLLGAVRHKGFIPWDDDIDVVMYRDHYNQLIKILETQYKEKYFAQTFFSDKYYTRYVLKMRLNNTHIVESYLNNSKANNGIYIDIFPLDHVKKNKGVGLTIRGWLLRILFGIKNIKCGTFISKKKIKRFFGKFLRVLTFFIPNCFINRLFDYVCEKDNKKECLFTTNFASHFKWKRQLFENSFYGSGTLLEFEGRAFIAPNEYLQILRRLYGDSFMNIPPKEQQITHELIEIDFGRYQ